MGGNAVLIDGEVDVAQATKPGFLGRLLGKKSINPTAQDGLVDLPARSFRFVGDGFQAYLRGGLVPAWPSTTAIIEYLKMSLNIYVRRDQQLNPQPSWYLQISFSGCSGMAQTSSDLAAHWASLWYQRKGESLRRDLVNQGFTPGRLRIDVEERMTFFPIGGLGYASFCVTSPSMAPDGGGEFAIDESAEEALGDDADSLMQVLDKRFQTLMGDGRCRCQMCDPGFDVASLSDLPGTS